MTIFMSGSCFSRDRVADSTLIQRVWDYPQNHQQSVSGIQRNVYFIYGFGLERRNPLLFLVPTMYSIAKGNMQYIGESYCKLRYQTKTDFDIERQVVSGTIPHHRNVMPSMIELTAPDIYSPMMYKDRLLSPFNRSNRFYYKYRVSEWSDSEVCIRFRPRSANTQLIKGLAMVNPETGHISFLMFQGEFDMIRFRVEIVMDRENWQYALPSRCKIQGSFHFLGNRIKASVSAYYKCPATLPDSIREQEDRQLMATLRPEPLDSSAAAIYRQYDQEHAAESDTLTQQRDSKFKDVAWDIIGDNLVNSIHANSRHLSLSTSPLLNPLYMSYSRRYGLSYKLKVRGHYIWNTHRYLSLEPQLGYNIKRKQFYYTIPLRMTYNPKRNGYAEIRFGNGEHISNDILADAFGKKAAGDSLSMPEFRDRYLQAVNNIEVYDWLEIMAGVVFHQRQSLDKPLMSRFGLPAEYRSFSSTLTLRLTPWQHGPTLTANHEHSFKNILRSDLEYDRWELDAVFKRYMNSIRLINMRLGAGFYTQRSSSYFVDYSNFRDNNLPSGWEDDWSGQFQLVPAKWYNQSRYYLRAHVSYDSPLLALSWIPGIGQFIESERVYVSALNIQDTRQYTEIGYGLKNRLFSTAIFSSFLATRIQQVGCKFTIELFRRW